MITHRQRGIETVVTLCILAAGCVDRGLSSEGLHVSQSDSAGIAVVKITGDVSSLPIWTFSEDPVTEISGEAPPFLGSVGEIELLGGGRLLIEDNQTDELRLFGPDGSVVRLVGGPGEGPGEFQNLTELTLGLGDTAFAYDRRTYRISVFDPEGALVNTIALGREYDGSGTLSMDAWALDSEHLFLHVLGPRTSASDDAWPRRDQRDALLHGLDGTGEDRTATVRFTGGYSIEGDYGDASSSFANRPMIAVGADRVLYGSGLDYELHVLTRELAPVQVIRWDGWREPLTETLIQAIRDTMEAGMQELRTARPEVANSLLDALFDPTLLPDSLPALSAALIDDQGRIWVQRFPPTTRAWEEEDAWHILAADGTPLARLRIPAQSRVASVRGGRVALIMRDELEIEHVRVFEILSDERGR